MYGVSMLLPQGGLFGYPTHLSGWVGFLLTFKKVLGPVRTTVTLRVPTVSIGEIVELPLRHCQVVLTKLNSIPA